ncbi:glutamate receptor 2.8-like [Phragmites australis]|uniref:glutamate receptor 2.8-like n=1 Tax=Phragmites australis TaxID=29695 RepID=UPI002D79C8B9|nr:glutamate receptor 2.8-like [Phragmites australis]
MEIALRSVLFFLMLFNYAAAQNATRGGLKELHVGVILDLGSLVGKIARTSISLAMDDSHAAHRNYSTRLVLHIRDSKSDDVQAASEAIDLLVNYKVEAIIGPQKSSQAVFISDLGNKSQVPIISFTATSPSLFSSSLPYFVRATLNDSAQVTSIASLIKAYGWREVVPIYEDTDYGRDIIPYFVDALQVIDARVPYRSVIPLSAKSEQITQELFRLMTMETRVFIVHMSSILASLLFIKAKEIGMMTKGYVWIMTDGVTSLIESLNPSVVESMNGALGVEFYVPKSKELNNFTARWNMRFQNDNPTDQPLKLSTFGLWGYDTIWAVAQAAEKVGLPNARSRNPPVTKKSTRLEDLETSSNGPELLNAILQTNLRGLSGNFDLRYRQLEVSTFRIINVVGKGGREIGVWTVQNGISRQLVQTRLTTAHSGTMPDLNPVIWPGDSIEVPRGFEIPVSGKKLQVGVRTSGYPEFIKVEKAHSTGATTARGLSVDVFEEAVKRLPYEYVAFGSTEDMGSRSYDDFVYQVYLKKYDIAIGDITITYNRTCYVDYTIPYTESGIAMIVPVQDGVNKNTWIFLKPLTPGMWFATIAIFIYTGIILLSLELLGNNENVRGPILRQLGIMIFFSIGEKEIVERFLSRIVLIVWLCFLLVLTSSYTANLSSILTVQQLQPTVTDVHELLKRGECVGYHRGSYVKGVLEELGFDRSKIKPYDTPDEFNIALSRGSSNGGIAALVHEVPYIKLFLAKHCERYTMVGPIYKSAGFGYVSSLVFDMLGLHSDTFLAQAFAKRDSIIGDLSRAILNITGGDNMIRIEKKWIGEQNNCQNVGTVTGSGSLTLANFKGLFILTGVASASSLLIALTIYFYKKKENSATIMQEYVEPGPRQENGTDGENNEPEEGSGGGRVEENIQPGEGIERNGQPIQQHGVEHLSDRSSQISTVMNNGSVVVHRGERTTSLQTESI